MAAIIIEIADAVTAEINAATLSQSFTAKRSYVPVHELSILSDLEVSVVPFNVIGNTIDRAGRQMLNYEVYVLIEKRLPIGELSEAQIIAYCDPYMLLAQELVDLFNGMMLSLAYDSLVPRCVDVKNSPCFSPHRLDEEGVFTSEIILNFKLGR